MFHIRYYIIGLCLFLSCKQAPYVFLNTEANINHVGMNKCASCHFEQYESYVKTGMGKSFKSALKAHSSSIFDSIL